MPASNRESFPALSLGIAASHVDADSFRRVADITCHLPGVSDYVLNHFIPAEQLGRVVEHIRERDPTKKIVYDPRDADRNLPEPQAYIDIAMEAGVHAVVAFMAGTEEEQVETLQEIKSIRDAKAANSENMQEEVNDTDNNNGLEIITSPLETRDPKISHVAVRRMLNTAQQEQISSMWFRASPSYIPAQVSDCLKSLQNGPIRRHYVARMFRPNGLLRNPAALGLYMGGIPRVLLAGEVVCVGPNRQNTRYHDPNLAVRQIIDEFIPQPSYLSQIREG